MSLQPRRLNFCKSPFFLTFDFFFLRPLHFLAQAQTLPKFHDNRINLPGISDDGTGDRRLRRVKRSKTDIPKQDVDQLIRAFYFGNQMLNTATKHGFREFAHIGAAEAHCRMLETLLHHSPAKILRTYTQFNFMEWTAKLQKQIAITLNIVQNAVKRLVQVLFLQPKLLFSCVHNFKLMQIYRHTRSKHKQYQRKLPSWKSD